MNEKALVPIGHEMTLQDTMTLGGTLAKSGYFSDANQAAQAVVKILAGREIGFGPIASMTGINIIKGRVTLGANLMAAAVKANPRYNYRVISLNDDGCEIAFFEGQQEAGRSIFTKQDAQRAGTQNMGKFPRNMLFARAMSNGVKWFCPDVMNGQTVYTPDELGAEVDEEGNMINVTPSPPSQDATFEEALDPPQEAEPPVTPPHWITDPKVRARFWAWTKEQTLTDAQVHEALGVEHVSDYTGTMGEAKADIEQYIANCAGQDLEAEESEPVEDVYDQVDDLPF